MNDEEPRIVDATGTPIPRRIPLWRSLSKRVKNIVVGVAAALTLLAGIVASSGTLLGLFAHNELTESVSITNVRRYELRETYKNQAWSEEKKVEGHTTCLPTEKNQRYVAYSVSVTVPANARIVSKNRRTDLYQFHDWGRLHDWWQKTSGGVLEIGYDFEHGIHDRSRGIYAEVIYQLPVTVTEERKLVIDHMEALPYGHYEVDLHQRHISYKLTVWDSADREYSIDPSREVHSNLSCHYEGEVGSQKLIIELRKPKAVANRS